MRQKFIRFFYPECVVVCRTKRCNLLVIGEAVEESEGGVLNY